MAFTYHDLTVLQNKHPAWRLLRNPHAPLIASFLNRVLRSRNLRMIAESDLVEALEDELFSLREHLGEDKFPRAARDYLNDWAEPGKGWLRKFYRGGSDEAFYDLTPATEKALVWLESLEERHFVGTESRLLTLFELLRQLTEGSTEDPELRLADLQKRRDALDREIAEVQAGHVAVLDDTALKERFMQFSQQARELLSDFREVEYNFRQLDRSVRERIATWDGRRGELLAVIMGERDSITDSDQGTSFRAFWDFLMSPQRQQDFTQMLEQVLSLDAIGDLAPDPRTRRIHYDWLEAGEHTQRTVAMLSQQLRRFLDDQAWLENRRIMEILRGIEGTTLELRDALFGADAPAAFTRIAQSSASIELPIERPLYRPPRKPSIASIRLEEGDDDTADTSALFDRVVIDKAAIAQHIRQSLQAHSQVSLASLCQNRPLRQGLAELVAYLEIAENKDGQHLFQVTVDESVEDTITWQRHAGETSTWRRAHMPRILFLRQ